MFTQRLISCVSMIAATGFAGVASADYLVADFDAPTYTTGSISGQDGWTANGSGGTFEVYTTTDSGDYIGGQAFKGNTYIGAKAAPAGNSVIQFDLFSAGPPSERAGVGFWGDTNDDDAFTQNELMAVAGFVNTAGGAFGIRGANFGPQFDSGVRAAANTWYRITATYDDVNTAITMEVIDLTNGSVAVDLNGAAAGTAFTADLSAAEYGVLSTNAKGYAIRVSGQYAVDNIISIGPVVPEPGSLALMGLGALAMIRRRRH